MALALLDRLNENIVVIFLRVRKFRSNARLANRDSYFVSKQNACNHNIINVLLGVLCDVCAFFSRCTYSL